MKFSLDGKEVSINVDANGNVTSVAPSGVEVSIAPDANGWYAIKAVFSDIEGDSAVLNFQGAGDADTFGAYLDNIKLVGVDFSTENTILSDINLSDSDNANLQSATVVLSNYAYGDVVNADDLPEGITATKTLNGDGDLVITLSGSATVAAYESALESLTFTTTSEDRSPREFTFTVNDGVKDSNTMNVTVDIGGCSLNPYTLPNTVDAVDDYGYADAAQGVFTVDDASSKGDTTTNHNQALPDVAASADGGYIVVWQEATGNTYNGAVSSDNNNDGDVNDSGETQWVSKHVNNDIYYQKYDKDGDPVGNPVKVNTTDARDQHDPHVTSLTDGRVLITWTSDDDYVSVDNYDNGSRYIRGQIFDENGTAVCEEFVVARAEYDPITALPDGGFIITWSADARYNNTDLGNTTDNPIHSDVHDVNGFGVFGQRYDAYGNTVGDKFQINTFAIGDQIDSDITLDSNGNVVVTWQSQNQDGSGYGVYMQKFTLTDGGVEKIGSETQVNTTTSGNQGDPEITAMINGGATVAWESSDGQIYVQIFNSDGTKSGGELCAGAGINPVITPNVNGFVLAYQSAGGIYTQTYKDGSLGDAIFAGSGSEPVLTVLADGGYVVMWQNSDGGISGLRFDSDGEAYVQNNFDMNEDSSITITAAQLMANDTDLEGDSFEVISVQGAVNGTVSMDAGGNITFIPDVDYVGAASFTYTIRDSHGATDTATVHLDVKPVGEPSVFVGTLCSADTHGTDVSVKEGEEVIFGVRISGAEAGSTLTLALADGTALDSDYNFDVFKYSFDGNNWIDVPANGAIALQEGASKLMVKTDTVADSHRDSGETFKLTATLSTGQSATGIATIIDESPSVDVDLNLTGNVISSNVNLVVNGSFENIAGVDAGGNTVADQQLTGTQWKAMQSIEGWTLMSGVNTPYMEPHAAGHASVGTSSGENYMDLGETQYGGDTDNENTHIGQKIAGVVSGVVYTVSFDYLDKAMIQEGADSGRMEVYFGGALVATIEGNNTVWNTQTLEVIGGSGDGSNILSFKEVGEDNDNWGMAIDSVSMSPKENMLEYGLDVSASLSSFEGSEALSVTLEGLPTNAVLSVGNAGTEAGEWIIPVSGANSIELKDIKMYVPEDTDTFKITAVAKATETDGSGDYTEVQDSVLYSGGESIDFDALQGVSTLNIDNGISQTVTNITLEDVLESENNQIFIKGDDADEVDLENEWKDTGTTTTDASGKTYNVFEHFENSNAHLNVDTETHVTNVHHDM